eukprot:s430_g6.t1
MLSGTSENEGRSSVTAEKMYIRWAAGLLHPGWSGPGMVPPEPCCCSRARCPVAALKCFIGTFGTVKASRGPTAGSCKVCAGSSLSGCSHLLLLHKLTQFQIRGLAPEPFGPREDHFTDAGRVALLVYSMSGRNGKTHEAISEYLRSGSVSPRSDSFLTITESELSQLSPRSDFFSPRFHRSTTQSESVTSFSPAALDKLCEVVDGAKVKFLGTPVFSRGDRVIVSFPGAHGRAWNRLMEGAGGWKTSCVFLPDKSTPGYGVHATRYFAHRVEKSCFCDMLYGESVEWGCRWFQMWMENTRRAEEMSCELVVVTKPDGSLGRSQSGEVEFLRKSGYKYEERSVREFAEDVLTIFLADLRAEGKSLRIRSPSRSRTRLPSLGATDESSDDEFAIELSSSNKRWPTDPEGLLLREQ